MLMEQMAGSEMKPPFSSLKNKINWGRGGGIICMKWPAHHPRKSDRKRGTITAAGVDDIPLATSVLLADISWNPTRFSAKWACFYSFPRHPLSLFSLRISSGTFYSLLQCIKVLPTSFMCGCCFVSSRLSSAKIKAAMTFPLVSCFGAKCVYWSTVMDSEEHKHRAAIRSDLIETPPTQRRRFFHSCAPVWKSNAVSPGRISRQPHKSNHCCSVPSNLFWKCRSVQIARQHVRQALLPIFFVTADLWLAPYAI